MNTKKDSLVYQCENVSGLLKTIAHPQRLTILVSLCEGEKTVSELEEFCGASQSSVSQYLGKMRAEGLLSSKRVAQQVYYRIESNELLKLMKALQKIFCE